MKLPEAFVARITSQRPADYEAFIASFEDETYQGLRVNTLKISVTEFLKRFPYKLEPIPWTTDGFYYREEDPVTKHPFYHAGLYYIQEPSAMAPIGTLALEPELRCLDLCAAPGGKSLQFATGTDDTGLLVTNDISDKRVKAIVRNIERFGLRNVVVLNETPERIAAHFGAYFDHVLVDAPCSGEGMFRKDPKAVSAWAVYENDRCAEMQRDILKSIPALMKLGSTLTYSTCTFAPDENENQMADFQREFIQMAPKSLASSAKPLVTAERLTESGFELTDSTMRLLPHKIMGEGHYIARLQCVGLEHSNRSDAQDVKRYDIKAYGRGISAIPPRALDDFMQAHLNTPYEGLFRTVKEKVYLLPEASMPVEGLRVAREGLYLGDLKGAQFVPSQAMALNLKPNQFKQCLELPADSLDIIKYLKCETLHVAHEGKGLHLVTTGGFPVGFCKLNGGTLKNLYPASWRMF